MNNQDAERDLVENALAAVQPLGLRTRIVEAEGPTSPQRPDAVVEIGRDADMVRYVVEVKRHVNAANVGAIAHELQSRQAPALLITTYVTPPVATRLRDLGVQFIDTAGNASLNNRTFLVWSKGEKPALQNQLEQDRFTRTTPDSGRAFRPRGLQVLFTLLCDPHRINDSFRDLAQMSGVALGTVAAVMSDLGRGAYVARVGGSPGERRMFKLKDLIQQWTDAYARELRPRTLISRMYASNSTGWDSWHLEGNAVWGGEPAGALLTRYLKPAELTLYVLKVPVELIARHRLLKQPEPGHTVPVDFRRRFWSFSNQARTDIPLTSTPPLLIYADLLATGDSRCLETANMIYKDHIARSVNQ